MSERTELIARAREWMAQDPDEATRAELDALLALVDTGSEQAAADLAERFSGRLQFGTAGLRGAMGAGPQRMNRVVVAQANEHHERKEGRDGTRADCVGLEASAHPVGAPNDRSDQLEDGGAQEDQRRLRRVDRGRCVVRQGHSQMRVRVH